MNQIAENLEFIRQRIATAAERSGRSDGEVKLVAVSKTYPPEVIREAVQAGQVRRRTRRRVRGHSGCADLAMNFTGLRGSAVRTDGF
jgi:hypothetical protein